MASRSSQARWSSRLAPGTAPSRGPQVVEIEAAPGPDLHDDESRDRQVIEVEAGPEPRFQQFFRLILAEDFDPFHIGRGTRDPGRLGDVGLDVVPRERSHLDRHLAPDGMLPGSGGAGHQDGTAGRERCQERHDRDDGHEGTTARWKKPERAARRGATGTSRPPRFERPATVPRGYSWRGRSSHVSLVDIKTAIAEDQATHLAELVHEGEIVGRDHH